MTYSRPPPNTRPPTLSHQRGKRSVPATSPSAIPGGVEGLYERVAPADAGPATPAPAAQPEVAEDRNVVVPGDSRLALRASRPRPNDGFSTGQAMDADIQEAADDGADEYRDHHRPLWTHPASAESLPDQARPRAHCT